MVIQFAYIKLKKKISFEYLNYTLNKEGVLQYLLIYLINVLN